MLYEHVKISLQKPLKDSRWDKSVWKFITVKGSELIKYPEIFSPL